MILTPCQANTTRSTTTATDLEAASPPSTMCAPLPEPEPLVLMLALMHMHTLLSPSLIMDLTIRDSLKGRQVRVIPVEIS